MNDTLYRNMSNEELISHIGWNAPPMVQSLVDRLEAAEAALQAHGELFQKVGRLDTAIDSLDTIYSNLEPIEVAESEESQFVLQVRTLAETIADVRKVYDEVMEVSE